MGHLGDAYIFISTHTHMAVYIKFQTNPQDVTLKSGSLFILNLHRSHCNSSFCVMKFTKNTGQNATGLHIYF